MYLDLFKFRNLPTLKRGSRVVHMWKQTVDKNTSLKDWCQRLGCHSDLINSAASHQTLNYSNLWQTENSEPHRHWQQHRQKGFATEKENRVNKELHDELDAHNRLLSLYTQTEESQKKTTPTPKPETVSWQHLCLSESFLHERASLDDEVPGCEPKRRNAVKMKEEPQVKLHI